MACRRNAVAVSPAPVPVMPTAPVRFVRDRLPHRIQLLTLFVPEETPNEMFPPRMRPVAMIFPTLRVPTVATLDACTNSSNCSLNVSTTSGSIWSYNVPEPPSGKLIALFFDARANKGKYHGGRRERIRTAKRRTKRHPRRSTPWEGETAAALGVVCRPEDSHRVAKNHTPYRGGGNCRRRRNE